MTDVHVRDKVKYAVMNLDRLAEGIRVGKLDPKYPINMHHLWKSGCVGKDLHAGVKLLANGAPTFSTPVTLEVAKASRSEGEPLGGHVRSCT